MRIIQRRSHVSVTGEQTDEPSLVHDVKHAGEIDAPDWVVEYIEDHFDNLHPMFKDENTQSVFSRLTAETSILNRDGTTHKIRTVWEICAEPV